jgi:hypothetical protein
VVVACKGELVAFHKRVAHKELAVQNPVDHRIVFLAGVHIVLDKKRDTPVVAVDRVAPVVAEMAVVEMVARGRCTSTRLLKIGYSQSFAYQSRPEWIALPV